MTGSAAGLHEEQNQARRAQRESQTESLDDAGEDEEEEEAQDDEQMGAEEEDGGDEDEDEDDDEEQPDPEQVEQISQTSESMVVQTCQAQKQVPRAA